jgi:zinc protease
MFAKFSRVIALVCVSNVFTVSALAAEKPVLAIQTWKTSVGTPVYYVKAPQLPMVDIQMVFNAGSAQDGQQAGLAKLTSAMLNEGTTTLNADQIANQFDSVGAIFSQDANRDMALVGLRSLTDPKYFNPAFSTFLNVVSTSNFPADAFARVQKQMLVSLDEQKQLPTAVASKAFFRKLYGDQPYGHPVFGTKKQLTAMTPADLNRFYRQLYVANNAIIAIVGDVDEQTARSLSEQLSKALPPGQKATAIPLATAATIDGVKQINFPSTQTTIMMGQVGITPTDNDYFPLLVGNYTLGGNGLVSRLFEQVRDTRGLAYHVSSSFYSMAGKGPFIVGLQTRNDQAQTSLDLTKQILEKFIKDGPDEKELTAAKKNIIGSFPLSLAGNDDILAQIVNIGYYQLPLNYLDTYRDKVKSVSREQIKQSFQQRLNVNSMVVVMVGQPVQNAKTNKSS